MYGTLTPGEVGEARDTNPRIQQMEEEPLMNDNGRGPAPSVAGGRGMANGASQGPPAATEAAQQGRLASPGEIADAKSAGPIHGESKPNLASPSEIADGQDQQQGRQQSQGHRQDRGRGM
jgi:hypothetical protein